MLDKPPDLDELIAQCVIALIKTLPTIITSIGNVLAKCRQISGKDQEPENKEQKRAKETEAS